jgi:hypothetical protein
VENVLVRIVPDVSDRRIGQRALLSLDDDLLQVAAEVVHAKVIQIGKKSYDHGR